MPDPVSTAPVPAPAQQPAADPNPQVPVTGISPASSVESPPPSGKNLNIPVSAMRTRLDEARATGRRALTVELDRDAQALGYASHAAMMDHLKRRNGQPPRQQAQAHQPAARPAAPSPAQTTEHVAPPKNPQDRKAFEKQQARIRELERREQLAQQQAREEASRRKKAERKAQAAEARANLERIAAGVGIKKIGQALFLFQEAHEGKSVEELAQVDEAKFFEALRQTDPYLFGEVTLPATTGTSSAVPGARTPPTPSATSVAAAGASQVDVMKMSDDEFAQHKRNRGIRVVSAGLG